MQAADIELAAISMQMIEGNWGAYDVSRGICFVTFGALFGLRVVTLRRNTFCALRFNYRQI